jgi:hypothetical protein
MITDYGYCFYREAVLKEVPAGLEGVAAVVVEWDVDAGAGGDGTG